MPPAVNPLVPGTASYGLRPIRFGLKPYLQFCHALDRALVELEARYPGTPRLLTLEARKRKLRRRAK